MNSIKTSEADSNWRHMLEFLDGTLPPAGVTVLNERLKTDDVLRAQFNELLLQQIKLKELAEEAVVMAEEVRLAAEPLAENIIPLTRSTDPGYASVVTAALPTSPRPRTNRFRSVLTLAAALTLLGVTGWFLTSPAQLARLSYLEGGLEIERDGRKVPAIVGTMIRAGDRLITPPSGHAAFTYLGESTEVSLEPLTNLRLDQSRGNKLVQLDRGGVMAAVASQKQGTLLRLVTPQASATVVGTRFKLATVERSTRLEVFEGAVSVLAGNAAPSLLVPAGHGVTVIPGQTVMLQRLAGDRGSVLLENWDPAGSPTNRIALSQLMFVSAELKPGHVRARGYLHPPRSGVYSFQINGTAGTELWLSDSDQPTAAKRVWPLADDAQPTAALPLRADRRYYVELRCAPSTESPSATVSWTMPGGLQRVIYGEYLSPFGPVGNP